MFNRKPTLALCVFLWVGLVFASFDAFAQRRILFDQVMKIPYALEVQSKIIESGKYRLIMESVAAKPTMVLQTTGGEIVTQVKGERIENIPKHELDLKKQTRLKIYRLRDYQEGGHWVYFVFDYHGSLGSRVLRWQFKVRQAPEEED